MSSPSGESEIDITPKGKGYSDYRPDPNFEQNSEYEHNAQFYAYDSNATQNPWTSEPSAKSAKPKKAHSCCNNSDPSFSGARVPEIETGIPFQTQYPHSVSLQSTSYPMGTFHHPPRHHYVNNSAQGGWGNHHGSYQNNVRMGCQYNPGQRQREGPHFMVSSPKPAQQTNIPLPTPVHRIDRVLFHKWLETNADTSSFNASLDENTQIRNPYESPYCPHNLKRDIPALVVPPDAIQNPVHYIHSSHLVLGTEPRFPPLHHSIATNSSSKSTLISDLTACSEPDSKTMCTLWPLESASPMEVFSPLSEGENGHYEAMSMVSSTVTSLTKSKIPTPHELHATKAQHWCNSCAYLTGSMVGLEKKFWEGAFCFECNTHGFIRDEATRCSCCQAVATITPQWEPKSKGLQGITFFITPRLEDSKEELSQPAFPEQLMKACSSRVLDKKEIFWRRDFRYHCLRKPWAESGSSLNDRAEEWFHTTSLGTATDGAQGYKSTAKGNLTAEVDC